MADKAKHAFGMLENIDTAIAAGTIDAYDILFVKDANGKTLTETFKVDGVTAVYAELISTYSVPTTSSPCIY